MVVVGDRECADQTLMVRARNASLGKKQMVMGLAELIAKLQDEIKNKQS
jgi:threonyl-tRNA synthetase